MTYSQAIDYIHSINWMFCNPGLDRIRTLCHALGDPQKDLKFIHVAGTNGKGSFCAMTERILREAGYRTGLYTSPYIVRFNERMQVCGEPIGDEELIELVELIRPHADAMEDRPTEFELITALAFLYFKRHNCDIVILECGLGGRLDATNLIEDAVLSVITNIALDHTAILGNTIEAIAAEKAGILKPNVPLLFCGTDPVAQCVIFDRADAMNLSKRTVNYDSLIVQRMGIDGTDFSFDSHRNLHLSLLGSYQPRNAAAVLTAVDLLRQNGHHIPETAVRKGLSSVIWPARFEILSHDPLFIADGGHNPDGIDAALESIRAYFPDQKIRIITGVMADKDYRYMAERIAQVAACVLCLTPDNPRALPAKEYAEVFRALGVDAHATDSVATAIRTAVSQAKKDNIPTVSLGSLYMYKEVRDALTGALK